MKTKMSSYFKIGDKIRITKKQDDVPVGATGIITGRYGVGPSMYVDITYMHDEVVYKKNSLVWHEDMEIYSE